MEQKYDNSVALQVPQTAPSNSSPLLEKNEVCGALKMTMVTTKPKPSSATDWKDPTPPSPPMNGMTKKRHSLFSWG